MGSTSSVPGRQGTAAPSRGMNTPRPSSTRIAWRMPVSWSGEELPAG
ncbi:MAG: hypothetical protein L6R48_08925 [Planctomycetes bacterium]|nr:hypothetical protein [Planctomycetota bacterium]